MLMSITRTLLRFLGFLRHRLDRTIPGAPECDQRDALLLEKLTLDVILMILDLLEPEHHMVLAVACKTFHGILYESAKAALVQDRSVRTAAFLQLLEKDVSWIRYYCHDCVTLHPLSRLWTRRPGRFAEPCRPHAATTSKSIVPFNFSDAQCVMNQHFWGERRGLPVSFLCFRQERVDEDVWRLWLPPTLASYSKTASWDVYWMPRIVRDDLLFAVGHKLRYRVRRASELVGSRAVPTFDEKYHDICPHVSAKRAWGSLEWRALSAIDIGKVNEVTSYPGLVP
ncbi:Uu.00g086290.m01.CDS01 [Anthostomella pinea]|uniref:Uu.00g086290.m01.CDS01 n=1 Tax=Anthostomella pinea TaxID=933095 RepID=A0AAI8YK07_9PEZI|nr:Uu.00g086290.m01.CDS01 [Anthostomella pinea]